MASHFDARTVVTYDPRGSERSLKYDPSHPTDPDIHADDLHRVIAAVDTGPVDLFASSGGAVNALALVAQHPGQVRTLVAHEPRLASILPDREWALTASTDRRVTPTGCGDASPSPARRSLMSVLTPVHPNSSRSLV